MDILNHQPIDSGVSKHTKAVADLVNGRLAEMKANPSVDKSLERLSVEVLVLIGLVGHLHSAVCDLERKMLND